MGLAGAKRKQVISDDPRNERWKRDTERIGFKLLTSMGWKPESASLNPSTPAAAPRKALTSIPSAKEDLLGLGASKTTASSVFSAFGSKGLRFVTAGAGEAERRRKTEGGDFASLLDRLNASASASPAPESAAEELRPKKKRRKEVAKEASPEAEAETIPPVKPAAAIVLSRNSSRARHLAAKRMASSSADLAGILGYELPNVAPIAALPIAEVPQPAAQSEELDLLDKQARKAERKRLKALAKASADTTEIEDSYAIDDEAARKAKKAARKAKRKAEREGQA